MPPEVDTSRALSATTFREFDDAATAPLHKFEGAEDYYRRSSSAQYVTRIRIPTLLLQSTDDPFQPGRCVPVEAFRDNEHILSAVMENGGHVGFVARSLPWKPVFWAEREMARFMQAMLGVRREK